MSGMSRVSTRAATKAASMAASLAHPKAVLTVDLRECCWAEMLDLPLVDSKALSSADYWEVMTAEWRAANSD